MSDVHAFCPSGVRPLIRRTGNVLCSALLALSLCDCASNPPQGTTVTEAGAFADRFCHVPPMAGEEKEVKYGIELHAEWVKKLDATGNLTHDESTKILQQLTDYSASVEQLHQSLEQACRTYAVCYAMKESRDACAKEYGDEMQKESDARKFYLDNLDKLSAIDRKVGAPPKASSDP